MCGVGSWLGYVDARTNLLPTRIVWPLFAAALVAVGVEAWLADDVGLVVRAVLEETSAVPSLREISPYRVALAAYAWRVDEVLSGEGAAPGDRLLVAHWVLLDAERTPAAALRPGAERRLVLEPFSANPQLEPHVLSETLAGPPDGPLWFAAGE